MTTQSLISLFVMGQLSLVIAVLVIKRPVSRIHLLAAAVLVTVVGYLVVSNSVMRAFVGPLYWLFYGLALLPPYLVWLFAIELFEFKRIPAGVRGLILLVPAVVFGLTLIQPDAAMTQLAHTAHRIVALGLLVHLAIPILLERHDDLLNRRRSFRVWFVGLIALHASAILIVELIYAGSAVPAFLETVNIVAIGLLVLGLSVPLLMVDEQIVWQFDPPVVTPPHHGSEPARDDGRPPSVAQTALIQALTELMDQGYYTTTGLTIRQLAEQLDATEHVLRAAINQHLGYRNFSAFLNAYRIPAAQKQLADPALANTPVLTIALGLGYASIGPFNRAFKAQLGMTPTEYRQSRRKT